MKRGALHKNKKVVCHIIGLYKFFAMANKSDFSDFEWYTEGYSSFDSHGALHDYKSRDLSTEKSSVEVEHSDNERLECKANKGTIAVQSKVDISECKGHDAIGMDCVHIGAQKFWMGLRQ